MSVVKKAEVSAEELSESPDATEESDTESSDSEFDDPEDYVDDISDEGT